MERLRYRSTSLTDLMVELHQRDLLAEARLAHLRRSLHERGRARRSRRDIGLSLIDRTKRG